MSVKFEKETVRDAPIPGGRRTDIAHEVGERLTGGKSQTGYLAVSALVAQMLGCADDCPLQAYLQQLQSNPLRTKMLTSGSLAALQELLASYIAKDISKHGHYFSSRVPKMAAYGAFISAPLGHLLISILQRMFAGRTSLRAKILQILVSNLIVRLPLPNNYWPRHISGANAWYLPRFRQFRIQSTSLPWLLSRALGHFTKYQQPSGLDSSLL